jgi:Fe-S oxidoreductase
LGKAAVRVLEKVGCTLTLPHQQICCGQPLFNSGYAAKSLPVIKKIIDAYAEYETIVFLSGSCLSAVVDDYPDLLTRAPEYKEKLDTLVAHSHEFSDFLVNDLQLTNVGATLNASIVYHRSCHLTRMLKIEKEPLALLSKVKGLTILELETRRTMLWLWRNIFGERAKNIGSNGKREMQNNRPKRCRYRLCSRSSMRHEYRWSTATNVQREINQASDSRYASC